MRLWFCGFVAGLLLCGVSLSSQGTFTEDKTITLSKRIASFSNLHDTAFSARKEMWEKTLRMIHDHPFGVGYDAFYRVFPYYRTPSLAAIEKRLASVSKSHNKTLEITVNTGFLGLFCNVWFFATVFFTFIRYAKRLKDKTHQFLMTGILGAFAGYLVQAQFNFDGMTLSLMLWTFLGIGVIMGGQWKGQLSDLKLQKSVFQRFPDSVKQSFSVGLIGIFGTAIFFLAKPLYADFLFKDAMNLKAMQGCDEQVISLLKQATKYSSFVGAYHYELGDCHAFFSEDDNAIKEFKQSLKAEPGQLIPYLRLASSYEQREEYNEALYWLQRAKRISKGLMPKMDFLVHVRLAQIYTMQEEVSLALKEYSQASHIDPKSPRVYWEMGLLLEQQGNIQKALQSYQKVLLLETQNKWEKMASEKIKSLKP